MSPRLQRLYDALQGALQGREVKLAERLGEITLEVGAADYHGVALTLRDHPELCFEQLMDLCGVDYSTYGARPWQRERFAAVLHLLSVSRNWRLRVRVFCPDDDFPKVDSVIDVWPSVNW